MNLLPHVVHAHVNPCKTAIHAVGNGYVSANVSVDILAADVETAQKKKVVYGKKKPAPKPKAASELEAQPSGAASEAAEDLAAVGSQAAAQSSISAAQDQAEQAKAEAVSAEGEQKAEQAEVGLKSTQVLVCSYLSQRQP